MDISTFKKLQEKQAQSKFSQKEFCKKEGLKPAIFSYWKKKVKISESKNPFVELSKSISELPRPSFKETLPFEYQLASGSKLFIPQNFDESSLKKLLRLVG